MSILVSLVLIGVWAGILIGIVCGFAIGYDRARRRYAVPSRSHRKGGLR